MQTNKPVIYVAGPYTSDPDANIKTAITYGEHFVKLGFAVLIPHLCKLWDDIRPHDWEYWLENCLNLVSRCDAVFRFDGESKGADLETSHASDRGIPVFTDIYEMVGMFSSQLKKQAATPTSNTQEDKNA